MSSGQVVPKQEPAGRGEVGWPHIVGPPEGDSEPERI